MNTSVSKLDDENEEKLEHGPWKVFGSLASTTPSTLSLMFILPSPKGHPFGTSWPYKWKASKISLRSSSFWEQILWTIHNFSTVCVLFYLNLKQCKFNVYTVKFVTTGENRSWILAPKKTSIYWFNSHN